jgi:hypothetical protein
VAQLKKFVPKYFESNPRDMTPRDPSNNGRYLGTSSMEHGLRREVYGSLQKSTSVLTERAGPVPSSEEPFELSHFQ